MPPTYFSVVQFTPDPRAGEFMNLGIFVFNDAGDVASTVMYSPKRLNSFAGKDVTRAVNRALADLRAMVTTGDDVREAATRWAQSIRLTEPRASLMPLDELLEQLTGTLLRPPTSRRRSTPKSEVLRNAAVSFERVFDQSDVTVQQSVAVEGAKTQHEVDLSLRNGHLILAAQALSFDRLPSKDIDRDVNSVAWVLDDIGRGREAPALAVFVAPPPPDNPQNQDAYLEASSLFRSLDAVVVSPGQIEEFAQSLAANHSEA